MVIDIAISLALVIGIYRGSWRGTMANLWSLIGVATAAGLARYLSRPTSRWIIQGVDWPYNYSIGVTFLVLFALLWLSTSFILGPTIQRAEQEADGTTLDRLASGLLAGLRSTIIVGVVVCGLILCTARWGAQSAAWAWNYHESRSGTWLLTHNLISPERFPHDFVLRAMLGYEEAPNAQARAALVQLGAHPMTRFLRADAELQGAIWHRDYEQLRTHPILLKLVTSREFLQYVDVITSPVLTAAPEVPEERFQELR